MKIKIIILLIILGFILFTQSTVWDNFLMKVDKLLLKNSLETFSETDKNNSRINIDDLTSVSLNNSIPPIKNPKFKSIQETEFLDEDLILGIFYNGEVKAYPYKILYQHEIVNDTIGDLPIAVTYCPLCETNPVFIRKTGAEITSFKASGRLYQSCLVMYDTNTETYWAQPWGIGIFGQNVNEVLDRIPATRTTLGAWKNIYPDTLILSSETGYKKDYSQNSYEEYQESEELSYPARNQDLLLIDPKKQISYIWLPNREKPFEKFSGESSYLSHDFVRKNNNSVDLIFNGVRMRAVWDNSLKTIIYITEEGEEYPSSNAYAFVYPAFFK